jgi:hypothetical protein
MFLLVGFYLFGAIGWIIAFTPILFIFATGNWLWILGFIPSFLLRKLFVVLSGFCHTKIIEKESGLSIKEQVDWDRRMR